MAVETDAHLYEIFRDHPEWIADLMNEPFPERSTFQSVTIKKVERRFDGLLIQVNRRKPLRVIEFQFFPALTFISGRRNCGLPCIGCIRGGKWKRASFFASRRLDQRPLPWTYIVHAVYLDRHHQDSRRQGIDSDGKSGRNG